MMHEDRFYNQFKTQLENYAPEVPAAVYSGMRRKLWLSQFLKFNATSLNVWYVGTAIILGAGLWLGNLSSAASAHQARLHTSEISFIPTMANTFAPEAMSTCSNATCDRTCAPKCAKAQEGSTPEIDNQDPIIDQPIAVVTTTPLSEPTVAEGSNDVFEASKETTPAEVPAISVEEAKPAKKTKGRKYKVPRY